MTPPGLPGPHPLTAITTGDGLDSIRAGSFSKVIPKCSGELVGLDPARIGYRVEFSRNQCGSPDAGSSISFLSDRRLLL
jgi:hypothetical protein